MSEDGVLSTECGENEKKKSILAAGEKCAKVKARKWKLGFFFSFL